MIEQRVALVTGGSRGIGRGICLEVAKVGYAVLINFNENLGAAEEARGQVAALGVPVEICQADVTSKSDRDLLVEYVMDRFGRIDLLVNSAGIAPKVRKDILETEEASFDRVLNTNLRAPYFLTARVARQMIDLIRAKSIDHAAIVNISSLRSYTAAGNYGEYCISKAGMSMVTKLFAVRLAEYGINVYEISPGIRNGHDLARVRPRVLQRETGQGHDAHQPLGQARGDRPRGGRHRPRPFPLQHRDRLRRRRRVALATSVAATAAGRLAARAGTREHG